MNNRTVGGLILVAVVLAAGAAVVVSRGSGERANSTGSSAETGKGELLLPRAREQLGKITRVRLKRGAVESVLESKEIDGKPAWVVASKFGYPAESERVRKFIGEVLDAKIVEAKTAKPELFERVGVADVDKPGSAGALIELMDAEGKPLGAVIVGNASQAPGSEDPALARPRYFVRRVGEQQSYLAAGNLSVVAEPMSWVQRSAWDLDAQRIRSASVTTKGADAAPDQVVAVSKEKPEDPGYKLENVPEGRAQKDEYAPMKVAQGLVGMTIDDVAPAATVDLSKPEVIAQARTFDGLILTATGVSKEGKKWWTLSAAFEEPAEAPKDDTAKASPDATRAKAAEINKRHAGWVYVLPEYKVPSLTTRWDDVLKPVEPPKPQAPGDTPATNDTPAIPDPGMGAPTPPAPK